MTTVAVTGASGFIASHVVEQCLAKGWTVKATVRDPSDAAKTAHLLALAGAKERLILHKADLTEDGSFDPVFVGCDCVFHTATPVIFNTEEGEKDIYTPGMQGMQQVLKATAKNGVKNFVFTSSMSAMAPQPPPDVKDESHWSDSAVQKSKNNWYGACKTDQEKLIPEFLATLPESERFRHVSICPTAVMGPMHQPGVNATMAKLAKMAAGDAFSQCPNDSMSFIDVRDCAALHIAGFENPEASGRYMCLIESWHWNDICALLKELHPAMKDVSPCEGDPAKPTQFNRARQDSLGVSIRDVRTTLKESVEELKAKGAL
mmetsp:Transcript_92134/g.269598  ORF Transcript_92134/g.269598 Transcript_92134/m.269598 type:complete len:318 (+) Transcript_92134:95-1048(+)